MRSLGTCLLVLGLAFSGHSESRRNPLFVSTQWLSDHLQDPGLVVLHVGFSRPEYRLGHIPGARFLWYDWLAISTPDASTEMPGLAQADTVLEMLGMHDTSTIVLCFTGSNLTTTTRMLLALTYFGFGDRTSILDGGLEQWKAEKRPVSTETPVVRRSSITLHERASTLVTADWLKDNLDNPAVAIIDARDRRFYEGNGGGIVRSGHIKGAQSIPFSSLVDSTNRLKAPAALQELFAEAGIKKGMTVVTYCHVGQQATLVYAVAKQLGYDSAVYDGSFQDWNLRGEKYPVEKAAPPPRQR
jgi:thiosulfate/3-mercaptopyruvate sulfurtransferase